MNVPFWLTWPGEPPLAVVPVLVGPLQALLALLPAILAAIGTMFLAVLKPAFIKRVLLEGISFRAMLLCPFGHKPEGRTPIQTGTGIAFAHEPLHAGVLQGIEYLERIGAVLLLERSGNARLCEYGMCTLVVGPAPDRSQKLLRHVIGQ